MGVSAPNRPPSPRVSPDPFPPDAPSALSEPASALDRSRSGEPSEASDSPVPLEGPGPPVSGVDSDAGDGSGGGEPEGTAGEEPPLEDDAVILEEDDESEAGDEREPGQWPDEAEDEGEDEDDDWTPSSEQELRPVEDEQPEVQPTSNAVTVPEGEFYCPECDFTTDVESSSLRAGDFCPECHRGSLTHRSDE